MPRRRVIWDHVHLFVEMPPAGGSAGATRHRRAPPDFGSTTRLRQHRSTSAAPVVPRGVPSQEPALLGAARGRVTGAPSADGRGAKVRHG